MNRSAELQAEKVGAFTQAVEARLRSVADFKGSKVTVALSGGADSVALCHFIATRALCYGISVKAAHLNHGLRGAESDGDEQFVRDFCAGLGIPLVCEKLSWQPGAHPGENTLRSLRYDFLWRAAEDGLLLTAHTLTDNCETLLLHIARGTRLGGMRGIPACSGRLLRPMIGLTRADIESYCADNQLAYRTDSTNLTEQYARNRIRHTVLAGLESVNPAAQKAMLGWVNEAEELYQYIDSEVTALLVRAAVPDDGTPSPDEAAAPSGNAEKVHTAASRDPLVPSRQPVGRFYARTFQEAPPVLVRYALNRLLSPYGDSSAARLAAAEKAVYQGGAVDWCDGVRLKCEKGLITLTGFSRQQESAPQQNTPNFEIPLAQGLWQPVPWLQLTVRKLVRQGGEQDDILFLEEKTDKILKINKKDLKFCLDYDIILRYSQLRGQQALPNTPVIRLRQAGDTFCPGAGRGTKTLKKWLNEIGCPVLLRQRLPLVAFDHTVIWLAQSGAACDYAANSQSSAVWVLDWQINKDNEE